MPANLFQNCNGGDVKTNVVNIAPHIPVNDHSKRNDGTFSREDFTFDKTRNTYTCPAGKIMTTTGHIHKDNVILCELQRVVPYDSSSVQVIQDGRLVIIGGAALAICRIFSGSAST
jgi:hypothetical protein